MHLRARDYTVVHYYLSAALQRVGERVRERCEMHPWTRDHNVIRDYPSAALQRVGGLVGSCKNGPPYR